MGNAKAVIGVDAMGGDHGPACIVPGALEALAPDSEFDLVFYGDKDAVTAELASCGADGLPVSVVHCAQDIDMGEAPASAIRNKKDSPIVRAMADQKLGQVQAVVSAGSTGAMVAASLIILGRLPGVDRPAIATLIPILEGEFLLLDAGANLQCTPEHLVCFARLGEVFARDLLGIARPSVGLLNIGGEAKKGTELNVVAHQLLAESDMNFLGNVEGNDLLRGTSDVVVTDGFTGNNTLKIIEGFARFMGALSQKPDLNEEQRAAFEAVLGYLDVNLSYEKYGGAMLLGVAGISIIAHGRSSSRAIANAVKAAARQIEIDLPAKLAGGQI